MLHHADCSRAEHQRHHRGATHRLRIAAVALLSMPLPALAQTWDGGATDDNFNSANNWNLNAVPINNGTANIVFDGLVRPSPDVNVNFSVNSITFAPTATNFTIQQAGTSTLTVLGGGIANNDSQVQIFDVPVNFGAASTISAATGDLTFRGDIGLGTSAVVVGGAANVNFSNFLAITGTGSLTKNNTNTFNISSDGSEQNYDLVLNAGTVNYTGSGPIFGNNASLQLNAGTLTIASILTLTIREGATLTKAAAATLSLGAGMFIDSGGDATLQGAYAVVPAGLYRVTGSGSTLTANEFSVNSDARLELLNSGAATFQTRFLVGSITDGTAVVDGGTLNATTVTSTSVVGGSGATGSLTVRNAGLADFTSRTIAIGSAGNGTVLVERDGDMVVGQFLIGTGGSGSGTVTVKGAGSTLRTTQTSASDIGMASGTTAVVNLEDGGELNLAGGLNIRPTGTLNINGGVLTMAPTRRITNEGVLNFNSGRIALGEGLGIGGADSLLGVNLSLTPGREVHSPSSVTVASPGALVIDGGVLRTLQLVNNGGTIDLRRGTLAITGPTAFNISPTGPLGANVTVGPATTLTADDATVTVASGGILTIAGGTFSAEALSNTGTFHIESGSATVLTTASNAAGAQMLIERTLNLGGSLTNSPGARLELSGGAARLSGSNTLQNQGLLTGHGTITTPLNNSITGEVRADSGHTLAFAGSPGANAGAINLRDGQIDFAQLLTNTPSGQINGRGALNFAGGLTNQGKMQFSGGPTDIYGNVSLTGGAGGGEIINSGSANVVTFYGNVTHNGDEIRTSPTNTTVFFGPVSGARPFTGPGAVRFESTFSPGNSAAAVSFQGSLTLATQSLLHIELAGPTPGTQYDQVHVAGPATLDGTLQLALLGGYIPTPGQTFDILTAVPIQGEFHTYSGLQLTTLPSGKLRFFEPHYSPTALTLLYIEALPGDANLDGRITISDYLRIDRGFARDLSGWANGDFNQSGHVDGADFFIIDGSYLAQLNPSPSSAAAVPEPSSLTLLLPSLVAFLRRPRRARSSMLTVYGWHGQRLA